MTSYANPNHPGKDLLSRVVEHKFNTYSDRLEVVERLAWDNHTRYINEQLLLNGLTIEKLEREVFEDGTRGAPRLKYLTGIDFVVISKDPEVITLDNDGEWVYGNLLDQYTKCERGHVGDKVSQIRKVRLMSKLAIARAL
jgi:hypothetical protein